TISLALLIGAGLFLRTVQNLRSVAVGFNPHNVLIFHVSVRAVGPSDQDRLNSLSNQIVEKVGTLPGVVSVGGATVAFWQTQVVGNRPFSVPGTNEPVVADFLGVGPGFFETLEIPRLAGRAMNAQDTAGPPKVVLINELAARRFFPGQHAVG